VPGVEQQVLWSPSFNGSVKVESRRDRLTSEVGALALRETLARLGVVEWLVEHLHDRRNPALITHPLSELLRTSLLLLGQGWRDQDDADTLRDDPLMRVAVSNRRGPGPLEEGGAGVPAGLASQPTLSRLVDAMSSDGNLDVLRDGLLEVAARRLRVEHEGQVPHCLTVDVDSLPVEVFGHQPGSEYNGHYHATVYHPLIATLGELGDLVGVRLRAGNVHTADGGLDFILGIVDRALNRLCREVWVRIDAGFPDDATLSGLEDRKEGKVHYVARVKNNAVLNRMAEPHLARRAEVTGPQPQTWFVETRYRAGTWSRERRVVLVVQEVAAEKGQADLFTTKHFWLITDWSEKEMPAAALLELYRQRGTAEGRFGELMNVLRPSLSSSPRSKTDYRGEPPRHHAPPCDAFAHNEVLLVLNALAYNAVHAVRVLLEQETREGWSLLRVRQSVLRVAARVLIHGRQVVVVIGRTFAGL
jgi:hypothetical protein